MKNGKILGETKENWCYKEIKLAKIVKIVNIWKYFVLIYILHYAIFSGFIKNLNDQKRDYQ